MPTYTYEKSASVWNQTWDFLCYTHVDNPSKNYAYGKLVGCLTTNELLFDTYVNDKLLHGMPSVVAFLLSATYGTAQLQGNECSCVSRGLHASDTRVSSE